MWGACSAGEPDLRDQATGAHWTFDGTEFWSFDGAYSAAWKADNTTGRGLRGAVFRELSGDDADATLLRALRAHFAGPAPACTP